MVAAAAAQWLGGGDGNGDGDGDGDGDSNGNGKGTTTTAMTTAKTMTTTTMCIGDGDGDGDGDGNGTAAPLPPPPIGCPPNQLQCAAPTNYWLGRGAWFGHCFTMALVPASCRQRTMVWAHHILWNGAALGIHKQRNQITIKEKAGKEFFICDTNFKKMGPDSQIWRVQIWNDRSQKQKKNYGKHPYYPSKTVVAM